MMINRPQVHVRPGAEIWLHVLEIESGLYGRLNQPKFDARPSSKSTGWWRYTPGGARDALTRRVYVLRFGAPTAHPGHV